MAVTYSADTVEDRAIVRAAVEAGTVQRTPVSAVVVCALLDLNTAQLNSMFTNMAVDGYHGLVVAAEIRERFGLDTDITSNLELGEGLALAGVLTEAEAAWLDDRD